MNSVSRISPDGMDLAHHWVDIHLGGDAPFFSFNYGKRSSADLIGGWKRTETSKKLDTRRTQRVAIYTDPSTRLQIRCVAVAYRDFPTIEWTLYFKNTSRKNTPIIANVQAVDMQLAGDEFDKNPRATHSVGKFLLHYHIGSLSNGEDYRPLVASLVPGSAKRVTTSGGRPCNAHMPFFNLETSGGGLIMAIGWPGQWAAEFGYDKKNNLRIAAGQELTHFTLHSGEEIRTPLIALQFYADDRVRAQNIWRRWMVAHNLPRPGGKLPTPQLAGIAFENFAPHGISNAQTLKVFIDTYEARKIIPLDAWWIDTGWYDCDASLSTEGYSTWGATGTWMPDRRRFPNGVREVNDYAHKKGLKTILWFEPERVYHPGTWLAEKHPLEIWRANDAADRQGITEIRHVTGHLAYWDELRRRHSKMFIDIYASGVRRNELEGLRRAVPLWRSDYTTGVGTNEENLARLSANQCITYGIASWIPYYGTGIPVVDAYFVRSLMCPSMVFSIDPRRDDINAELGRRLTAQFKQAAHIFRYKRKKT